MNPCKDTFEVHLTLGSAQIKKDMKHGRAMLAAAAQGFFIYVAGGINEKKEEMAECEVFDIK